MLELRGGPLPVLLYALAAAGDSIPPGSGFFCALRAPQRASLIAPHPKRWGSMVGMSSRLFDSRRYHRRLSVSMPDQTAEELLRLAASAGVSVAAVIREALRRSLPAIRREIKRNAAAGGPLPAAPPETSE